MRDQPKYKSFLNSDLFSVLISNGVHVYEKPYKYLHLKAVDIYYGIYLSIGSLHKQLINENHNLMDKRLSFKFTFQ